LRTIGGLKLQWDLNKIRIKYINSTYININYILGGHVKKKKLHTGGKKEGRFMHDLHQSKQKKRIYFFNETSLDSYEYSIDGNEVKKCNTMYKSLVQEEKKL
jgi:hypothetical protein